MNKQFSKFIVLVLLSSASFFCSAKTIPGTNCVDFSNQDDVSYNFHGYMKNDVVVGDGSNFVSCPIIRDSIIGKRNHFKRPVRVQLELGFNNFTDCQLHSRNREGDAGNFQIAGNFVAPTGFVTHTFALPVQSYTWGTMNLMCNMKFDDKLHGYNYVEK